MDKKTQEIFEEFNNKLANLFDNALLEIDDKTERMNLLMSVTMTLKRF